MTLISSYLITTKNLESFFNSLLTAKAPQVFTQKFLENLEFKSTNDRLYINLLKNLGFLDSSGVPTDMYYSFLDQSNSKKILAKAIRAAYEDLFSVNKNANTLTTKEVKNKLKTLNQGKYSETVFGLMANTFKALVGYAEWNDEELNEPEGSQNESKPNFSAPSTEHSLNNVEKKDSLKNKSEVEIDKLQFHYNIQIHLPESRDPAVYDVLFESLKKHLF